MASISRRGCIIRTLVSLSAVLGLTGAIHAATINVPADQPTIAAGVAAAGVNDTVLVAPGTYTETTGINFGQNNVTLQGSGLVVLRGPATEDSLIYINGGRTGITISGITIERPTANSDWMRCINAAGNSQVTVTDCVIQGPGCGVGIILFNSADATITSCTFGNFNATASWAGAVSVEGTSGSGFSDVTVDGCTFATGCNRWFSSTGVAKVGELRFTNNNCQAARGRNALYLHGNCPYDSTKGLLFENCVMNGTTLELGEFFYTNAGGPQSVTFRKLRINAYDSTRKIFWFDLPAPTVFEDVVVAGGKHQVLFQIWGGPPSVNLYHCTLVNDGASAAEGAGGVAGSSFINGWDGGRTFQVRNCIFYSPTNYTAGLVGDSGSSGNRVYDIAYSVLSHPTPSGAFVTLNTGTNYSNTTPIFTNAGARDYSLAGGSVGLGEGIDLGYTSDAIGALRPNPPASPPDIGAFESVFVPVELSEFELI